MAPIRRVMAASLGKMATASVRRLISPLRRSSGLVLCSLVRFWDWEAHVGQYVGSAWFIRVASLGTLDLSWSATRRRCAAARLGSSWAKAVAMKADTARLP